MEGSVPHWLLVGIGGFVGSLGRYFGTGLVHRMLPRLVFPIGTLLVNAVGCLLIGLIGGLAETRGGLSQESRVFLVVGLLGGMTTFSSFGYECFDMIREGRYAVAVINVSAQVILGVSAAWAGHSLSRVF